MVPRVPGGDAAHLGAVNVLPGVRFADDDDADRRRQGLLAAGTWQGSCTGERPATGEPAERAHGKADLISGRVDDAGETRERALGIAIPARRPRRGLRADGIIGPPE